VLTEVESNRPKLFKRKEEKEPPFAVLRVAVYKPLSITTVCSSSAGPNLVAVPSLAGFSFLTDLSTGRSTRGVKSPGRRSEAGKTAFIYHGVKIKTIAIKAKARIVFLFIYLGSGSAPPSEKG